MDPDGIKTIYAYYALRSPQVARGVVLKTDAFNECGFRWWAVPIVDKLKAEEVHCVEIDGARAAICKERFPFVNVHHADLLTVQFKDAKFDTILDLSTIDHVGQWQQLLENYWRWLKTGGELLVIVWLSDGDRYMGRIGADHEYAFSRSAFTAAVEARFDILSVRSLYQEEVRELVEIHTRKKDEHR